MSVIIAGIVIPDNKTAIATMNPMIGGDKIFLKLIFLQETLSALESFAIRMEPIVHVDIVFNT